uniref:Uncharacterized protein n=1 Tax=Meloidogyne incognita TaxID=6306 RepID=A0A914L169_MELIC
MDNSLPASVLLNIEKKVILQWALKISKKDINTHKIRVIIRIISNRLKIVFLFITIIHIILIPTAVQILNLKFWLS